MQLISYEESDKRVKQSLWNMDLEVQKEEKESLVVRPWVKKE